MSIIVVCDLRPHADQAEATIQRAVEQLSLPPRAVTGRRLARLFRHAADPTHLLYLAEWESQAAFEAYRQVAPLPGTPDQLQDPPTIRFYRRLAHFERALAPVAAIQIDSIEGPSSSQAQRRALLLDHHRARARQDAGPVLFQLHEAADGPAGLLVVTGWASTDAWGPDDQRAHAAVLAELAESGATVQSFVGEVVIEAPGS